MAPRPPLPAFLTKPLGSPRLELALVAAVACGACGLAGCYPRLEDGLVYRLVMAVMAAAGGVAVVLGGVSAPSRGRAFGHALGISVVLGIACTVIPAAIMTSGSPDHGALGLVVIFGPIFGGPTGFVYGLPLATLATIVQPHVHAQTQDARDRLTRTLSIWSVLLAIVPFAILPLDLQFASMSGASASSTIAASIIDAFLFAIGCVRGTKAHLRLRARRKWLASVRASEQPSFRIRDAVEGEVLEWSPPLVEETSPYREQERGWETMAVLGR